RGVKADRSKLASCVEKVLQRVDEENNRFRRVWLGRKPYRSILIPMLGAGDGGLPVEEVADTIMPSAIEYFQNTEMPTLRSIFFLAFTARDKNAVVRALDRFCADRVLSLIKED